MLEQRPVLATPPAKSRAAASEVAGVGKRWPGRRSLFGRAAPAVDVLVNVTFAVRPGEIVVVLGENGAGKTTLLKIVGGLARPETGDVRVLRLRCRQTVNRALRARRLCRGRTRLLLPLDRARKSCVLQRARRSTRAGARRALLETA